MTTESIKREKVVENNMQHLNSPKKHVFFLLVSRCFKRTSYNLEVTNEFNSANGTLTASTGTACLTSWDVPRQLRTNCGATIPPDSCGFLQFNCSSECRGLLEASSTKVGVPCHVCSLSFFISEAHAALKTCTNAEIR